MNKMLFKQLSQGLLAASLCVVTLGAMSLPAADAQGMPPLQGYVVTVPSGTTMSASLQSPISSEYARPGDRFNATLGSAVAGNGGVVLPAGSMLEGQVVSVTKAGRASRNGQLEVRFTSARTPSGETIPISARIQTEDGSGILKGGTATGRAGATLGRAAVGAGLGAALGTAMGPLSGGSVGRGAIYGTAIGGGLGTIYAGAKKGDDVVLPAGQPVNIVLDSPISYTQQPAPAFQQGYNTNPYGQQPYGQQPYGQQNPYNTNPYGSSADPYGSTTNPYSAPTTNYYGQ